MDLSSVGHNLPRDIVELFGQVDRAWTTQLLPEDNVLRPGHAEDRFTVACSVTSEAMQSLFRSSEVAEKFVVMQVGRIYQVQATHELEEQHHVAGVTTFTASSLMADIGAAAPQEEPNNPPGKRRRKGIGTFGSTGASASSPCPSVALAAASGPVSFDADTCDWTWC